MSAVVTKSRRRNPIGTAGSATLGLTGLAPRGVLCSKQRMAGMTSTNHITNKGAR